MKVYVIWSREFAPQVTAGIERAKGVINELIEQSGWTWPVECDRKNRVERWDGEQRLMLSAQINSNPWVQAELVEVRAELIEVQNPQEVSHL